MKNELDKHLALNVKQLSELIGLSTDTIYTLKSMGRLPYIKVGRRVLFPVKAIEKWLEKNTVNSRE